MKEQTTISKINTELIRAFAMLDAWFDKAFDNGFDNGDQWMTREVLERIITSNFHLLDLLSDGCDYALSKLTRDNNASDSFHAIRFTLRDQLFQCLCVLDDLEQIDDDDNKEMNVSDKLSSLIHHLHYHLDQLEHSALIK